VAERLAAIDRAAAEDRRRIAALRTEIQRAGELEVEKKRQAALDEITDAESTLDQGELATPRFVPPAIAPFAEFEFDDDTPLMRDDEVLDAPAPFEPAPVAVAGETPSPATTGTGAAGDSSRRKRWALAGAAAGMIALAGASAFVIGSRNTRVPPATAPGARSVVPSAPLAAHAPAVPLPAAPVLDSSAGALVQPADSSGPVAPVVKRKPKPIVREVPARRENVVRPQDSLLSQPPGMTPTTPPIRDTVVPRRDTSVRRDSAPPPDTTAIPPG
jgi:hypothetical protein